MKTVWQNLHDPDALCEKQEHERLLLMIPGDKSFYCCLEQLIEVNHSGQSLLSKSPSVPEKVKKWNENKNAHVTTCAAAH